MNFRKKILVTSVIAAVATLSGCSGSSDDTTSSGNSETVQGRITGFGSIFVNNVEYETHDARITIDGKPASEDDLKLGMVVTVRGNSSGHHGYAESVDFNDDVEGVISQVNLDQNRIGTIVVMGYTVTVDENTILEFETTNIDSLTQAVYDPNVGIQHVAEISGYSDGQGSIHATHIEVKSYNSNNGVIEIKGFVKNHDSNSNTFMIANMEILHSSATRFDDMPNGVVSDGMYVEVKGHGFDDQGRLIADKIENYGRDGVNSGDSDDDYKIEGVISLVSDESFQINGKTVYYNQNTKGINYLVENALVEVEAYRDSQSRLVAHEVHIDELDDKHHKGVEMKGMVQSIDTSNNTIQIMGKTIQVNSSTMMCDEYTHIRYFSLQDIDLTTGDHYVEIKAYLDSSSNLVASKLTYEGINKNEMDELEGPLLIDDMGAYVMGIAIEFGNFTTPSHGVRVELKGTYSDGMFYVSSLESESDNDSNS